MTTGTNWMHRDATDEPDGYVDMIMGLWEWYSNGAPAAFLELKEDGTCAFFNYPELTTHLAMEYCEWNWYDEHEQL